MLEKLRVFVLFAFMAGGMISATSGYAEDWPSWRGPSGSGVVDESSFPNDWGPENNVRWKVELPGPGNSSPIVVGDRVWITQYEKESRSRQLRCYSLASGESLWTKSVVAEEDEPTHPTNPYCAASPVANEKFVVAFFGAAGLYCYTVDGELKWQKKFGSPQHLFGQGASPLIHGGLVTLNYGPGTEQFWVTLELETGREVWRLAIDKVDAPNPFDAPDGPKLPPGTKLRDPFGTWATPVLAKGPEREELLLAFPKELRAVDPESGSTLWSCEDLGNQILTSPFLVGDTAVCMAGSALAVKLFGSGDVTDDRLWFEEEDRPRIGTGVGVGEDLVIVNTMQGIVEGIALSTGDRLWQERLTTGGNSGASWSSLVRAGDRILATNKSGAVFVFTAKPDFQLLATNEMGETTNASPAVTADSLLIRTDKHLWCIGQPGKS